MSTLGKYRTTDVGPDAQLGSSDSATHTINFAIPAKDYSTVVTSVLL